MRVGQSATGSSPLKGVSQHITIAQVWCKSPSIKVSVHDSTHPHRRSCYLLLKFSIVFFTFKMYVPCSKHTKRIYFLKVQGLTENKGTYVQPFCVRIKRWHIYFPNIKSLCKCNMVWWFSIIWFLCNSTIYNKWKGYLISQLSVWSGHNSFSKSYIIRHYFCLLLL